MCLLSRCPIKECRCESTFSLILGLMQGERALRLCISGAAIRIAYFFEASLSTFANRRNKNTYLGEQLKWNSIKNRTREAIITRVLFNVSGAKETSRTWRCHLQLRRCSWLLSDYQTESSREACHPTCGSRVSQTVNSACTWTGTQHPLACEIPTFQMRYLRLKEPQGLT